MDRFGVELIQRNKNVFRNYNQLRCQHAYDFNVEKATVAFEIIPVLLTVNEPDLPGYVSGGEAACGIYGIRSSNDLKRVIKDYFPELQKRRISYQKYFVRRPIIESLFIIGSIGTVAQTESSDFDYWVCVEKSLPPGVSINKLRQKTDKITQWCENKFDMEVHFFVLNLEQIRMNDFGKVDEESTGSSQRKFLKEECYRTMLLVSGKIPLWWVLPPEISQEDYERNCDWVAKEDSDVLAGLVDLGYMGAISREEFLGTALWNLTKGIKDPFKALLKMAMMERYLSDSFQGPLLCDIMKERVLGESGIMRDVDPYLLLVETVLEFYDQQKKTEQMDLLKKAFYIKADPKITRMRLKTLKDGYKVEVFNQLMKNWGWSVDLAEDLNQLGNWSYARHLKFSAEINKSFFSTYKRLSENLLGVKEKQAIDEYDLTLLGRKIFALFAKQKNKLQLTPFLTNKRMILKRCIFQFDRDRSGKVRWLLYDATRYPYERHNAKLKIFSSYMVVRAAAWLVINGLYDFHTTKIELPTNPLDFNINDLIDLLKHLQVVFMPAVQGGSMGINLQDEARKDRIMVVVDMEEPVRSKDPTGFDIIFRNTWGEIFTERYRFEKGISVLKDYVEGLDIKNVQDVTSKVVVHVPRASQAMNAKRLIYQSILEDMTTKHKGTKDLDIREQYSPTVKGNV